MFNKKNIILLQDYVRDSSEARLGNPSASTKHIRQLFKLGVHASWPHCCLSHISLIIHFPTLGISPIDLDFLHIYCRLKYIHTEGFSLVNMHFALHNHIRVGTYYVSVLPNCMIIAIQARHFAIKIGAIYISRTATFVCCPAILIVASHTFMFICMNVKSKWIDSLWTWLFKHIKLSWLSAKDFASSTKSNKFAVLYHSSANHSSFERFRYGILFVVP